MKREDLEKRYESDSKILKSFRQGKRRKYADNELYQYIRKRRYHLKKKLERIKKEEQS